METKPQGMIPQSYGAERWRNREDDTTRGRITARGRERRERIGLKCGTERGTKRRGKPELRVTGGSVVTGGQHSMEEGQRSCGRR